MLIIFFQIFGMELRLNNTKAAIQGALHEDQSNQHTTNNEQKHCYQAGIQRYWTSNCSYRVCLHGDPQNKHRLLGCVRIL